MNKKIILSTISLITVALLTGCGGSNSSTPTETTEETTSNNTLTGYFIDAKVSGVAYKTTSGENGTTDEFGRFNYKSGDQVQLSIGNLLLGEIAPTDQGLITPETLAKGDIELKNLLLRTLQSLDSDNNTSNGITIPSNLLTTIPETRIDDNNEATLLELDDTFKDLLDEDNDDSIDVQEAEATIHFEESTQDWDDGKRPDDTENTSNGNNSNDSDENNNGSEDTNNGNNSNNSNENNNGSEDTNNGNNLNVDEIPNDSEDTNNSSNDLSTPEENLDNTTNNTDVNSSGQGSNIGYLKNNHTNYSQHGSSSLLPKATKSSIEKSINWAITATTEDGATKLADHIEFMIARLKEGGNPRGWDKLFLMEAYMKFNHYYTTEVEQTNTDVVISKKATTTCAYDVISAHSDAVSGDFFGKGDIEIDNSSTAESILASTSCDEERTTVEAYILERQEDKPDETTTTENGNGNGNGN